MADVHSSETRSYNMSQIKAKNTKPEVIVRKFLFSKGLRYRKNDKRLPGHPDIVLPKYRTVIFVNGCFWHMHDCPYFVLPKTNTSFWEAKLKKNKERDNLIIDQLKSRHWRVIIIWECELKSKKRLNTLENLYKEIISQQLPNHMNLEKSTKYYGI
ncbi:very short patch repair endonuclease [Sedimentibacter sp.]|uniref:very short patch repair endonuclease n=1 Tax=Sedimentibacter sp. TaxID=1960295 RepID=UPI0028B0F4BF|nr:very short patch repair endonuclease [Sedimentibacter sp.]